MALFSQTVGSEAGLVYIENPENPPTVASKIPHESDIHKKKCESNNRDRDRMTYKLIYVLTSRYCLQSEVFLMDCSVRIPEEDKRAVSLTFISS